MVEQSDPISRTFAALADPTRRQIVERVSREPLTISALADPLAMSMQAVSKHIAILERSGLIKRHAKGRERLVAIQPAAITSIAQWASDQQRFWEDALDRLTHLLESESPAPHPPPHTAPYTPEGASQAPLTSRVPSRARIRKQKGTP
jgi:DNA-binding transcriptional ArsR family regulator